MSRRAVATLLVTLGSLASACPAAATPRSSHKGSGRRCSRAGRAEELSLGDQFPTLQTVRVLARVVAEEIVAVHESVSQPCEHHRIDSRTKECLNRCARCKSTRRRDIVGNRIGKKVGCCECWVTS